MGRFIARYTWWWPSGIALIVGAVYLAGSFLQSPPPLPPAPLSPEGCSFRERYDLITNGKDGEEVTRILGPPHYKLRCGALDVEPEWVWREGSETVRITMNEYDWPFKVIRNRFSPSKHNPGNE